jgi:ribonuclease HI
VGAYWNKESVEECYKSWALDRSIILYAGMPSLMVSNLWWAHNSTILKDKWVDPGIKTTITLIQETKFKEDPKIQKPHLPIPPSLDYDTPWGYLDNAIQGNPPSCGVGVVLYLNHNHYIFIGYSLGSIMNNKAEITTLWTLLETTKKKDVRKLQVLGDSKLVIECQAQGKIGIQNTSLAPFMREIRLIFHSFKWLSFHHILRELNEKTYEFSKEALLLQRGSFRYYEYFEGIETKSMEARL